MGKYNFLIFNIFRKKRLCKFVFKMFFIITVCYISILGLNNGVKNKYNEIKNKYIGDSYIVLVTNKKLDTVINEIKQVGHIKQYYPLMYIENDVYNFTYFDDNLISIKTGRNILSKNEIIVPESFNKNIDDIISVYINGENYQLKVVGIYENNKYRFSINNDLDNPVFTSFDFLNEKIELNSIHEVVIQVDDYDNMSKFYDGIHKYGDYDTIVNDENSIILDRYHNFCTIVDVLSKVITLFSILFIIIIINVIINDYKLDIAIMKSMGYSNNIIFLLLLNYSLLLLLLNSIPSTSFLFILSMIFKKLLIISFNLFLKCYISFIIIIFFTFLLLHFNIRKVNIVKLMKD